MSLARDVAPHLAVFGIAAALAITVATREQKKPPSAGREQDVVVWQGRPEAVSAVRFESKKLTLRLDSHRDAAGRWYVAEVVKTTPAAPAPPVADAGPAAAPPPAPEPRKETNRFVSVGQGDKLVEGLAPMLAYRALGRLEEARAAEFGFDEPEGTLFVTVSGTEHSLVVGGPTPGGSDRYVKSPASGEVYAVNGETIRSLQFADSRLIEREVHGFKVEDIDRVRIDRGGQRRELVRVPDKKDGWADAASPGALDETSGNWMTKLGRLRAATYVEKPEGEATKIVRVEYLERDKVKGWIELHKVAGAQGAEYLVQTEHTRWFGKVTRSAAESLETDLTSVVK